MLHLVLPMYNHHVVRQVPESTLTPVTGDSRRVCLPIGRRSRRKPPCELRSDLGGEAIEELQLGSQRAVELPLSATGDEPLQSACH